MRVSRGAIAAMVVAGVLGALAGCGDDDDSGADETTTEEATTAATTEAEPTGDVAAGMTFFSQTCESCHLDGGNAAGGAGPQLAGAGLTEQQIRDQVVNGGGGMPPNLAQGQDLDNVTAYVLSLQ